MNYIDSKQINWTVVCVYEFAKHKILNPKSAFQYLLAYGGMQFLKDYYAAEHLLSLEDTIEALDQVCKQNGGQI